MRDPSVQSGMGSYNFNPIDTQPGFGNRSGMVPPSPYSQSQPLSTPFNTAQPPMYTGQNSFSSPQPLNPQMAPVPGAPPTFPPTVMNSAENTYNGNSGYYGGNEVGVDAAKNLPLPPTASAPPGWNDPPALSASQKSQVNLIL